MQKNFQIRTLTKQLLTKYRFLKKSPQISHIHENRNYVSTCIIGFFSDQLLLLCRYHGNDLREILFSNFASCESLNTRMHIKLRSSAILKIWQRHHNLGRHQHLGKFVMAAAV